MPKTYNPYCIVNYYYYQCCGQILYCKDYPLENYSNERNYKMLLEITEKVIENELNDREKEIIYCYYYDRLTQEEIAKHLGISASAICRYLKRIRRKLYGFLKYVVEYHKCAME